MKEYEIKCPKRQKCNEVLQARINRVKNIAAKYLMIYSIVLFITAGCSAEKKPITPKRDYTDAIKTAQQRKNNPPPQTKQQPEYKLDLEKLYGLTPSKLKELFPSLVDYQQNGKTQTIDEFQYWKKISLSFNNQSRLCSITLTPLEPMEFGYARNLIKKNYNVYLLDGNRKDSLSAKSYRYQDGLIKTVNFNHKDFKNDDMRISEIGIFYSIPWDSEY